MCGVFGYVTDRDEALGPILVEAAQRLTYRGYDSVGAATFRDGTIDLRKDVGKVDAVAARHGFAEMRGSRGIAQLRWATFGEPSQVNAQPHLDSDGAMAGAHNGNVVNNAELRVEFLAEGMTVRSENDGETCVHAVERYVRRGYTFIDAIRLAFGDLQGDYAFVIGRADDDRLYAFKKGSGLVVGIGDGFTCVSSDLPSILPLTRNVIRPLDGEIVTLWADRVEVRSVKDGRLVERPVEIVTESMDAVMKGGYAHFMLKEIHEQPQVARELLHLLDASADVAPLVEQMRGARHLFLVGCGTSFHAASLGSVYFAQLAGRVAIPVLAPQFIAQYAPAVGHEDVGIFVSQSGETKDVLNALEAAERRGMTCVRPGQRRRLQPDPRRPALPAARLRLRDQRAGHQDVHEPGPDVPLPGLPPGREGHGPPRACAGSHGGDARGRGRPGRGHLRRDQRLGYRCTASATARPTRSPSRVPSSSRRSRTRTAKGCSRPSSSTARCPR